jgi:hypothetical protein
LSPFPRYDIVPISPFMLLSPFPRLCYCPHFPVYVIVPMSPFMLLSLFLFYTVRMARVMTVAQQYSFRDVSIAVTDVTSLVFGVRACSNAHIALSEVRVTSGDTCSYSILGVLCGGVVVQW